MRDGLHLTEEGSNALRDTALFMNGGGRYRRVHRIGDQNPQRPYARHERLFS
jgi:hypothetical protein